jgi:hypothetical protein
MFSSEVELPAGSPDKTNFIIWKWWDINWGRCRF